MSLVIGLWLLVCMVNEMQMPKKRKPKPSLATIQKKSTAIFYELEDLMEILFCRRLDEYEYEDIDDYAAPINAKLKKFGTIVNKMYSRPFGFTYTIHGETFRISITKYKYKQAYVPK